MKPFLISKEEDLTCQRYSAVILLKLQGDKLFIVISLNCFVFFEILIGKKEEKRGSTINGVLLKKKQPF